jgi:hypothetical protein
LKVLYSPVRSDKFIGYSFIGEIITVDMEEGRDTFDFSGMPNGKAENITTILPFNPILWAERKDGVLSVELIKYIGPDATDQERFPEWMEV